MMVGGLPEGIITRFRTLSLERIGRVESVWNALIQGADDEEAVRAMSRDLHTLKGDAKVVGFEEVHVLAQKLEELVAVASHHDYRVSEDFELVVTMATQFASMLIKKRTAVASGIDLGGFLRQVDDVLRETRVLRKARPTNPRLSPLAFENADRLSPEARSRLAIAASDTFIEYLSARNPASRARLHNVWRTLAAELSRLQTIDLAPLLERHRSAGEALATDLGKQVELATSARNIRLDPRVAEALEMSVLHLVRNAIDHGIERPAVRATVNKRLIGRIAIRVEETSGTIKLVVEDDGAGIDLEAVRRKAIARGLVTTDRILPERELLELLFHPGFSTREDVGDVSGRGVGLDAVKAGLIKVGGTVTIKNRFGVGTTITLVVPAPVRQLRVFQFLAPAGAVNLAVSARWTPTLEPPTNDAIDPFAAMELAVHSRQTLSDIHSPKQLVVRLRWGFLEIPLKIATEPVLATAERICPTPDEHPVEVIMIDGVEALLLRPEHITSASRP